MTTYLPRENHDMGASTEVIAVDSNNETTRFTHGRGFYVDDGILYVTNADGRPIGAMRTWVQVALTDI